jgi:ABC-2 type transport system permease protein
MGVKHALRVFGAYAKLHARTALEYRINFLVQASFMFFNNALYLFLFYVLFQSFGTINGYTFNDVALIQGIAMIAIGLAHGLFGGTARISEWVYTGKLDLFLSQPFSALTHISISRSAQDAWGDLALGLVVIIAIVPERIFLALVCSVIGAVAFVAVEIAINTLVFVLARPTALVRSMRYSAIALGSWPMDIYPSAVRFLVYALGLAFISTVPRNIVMNFSWTALGILFAVACAMLLIATWLFNAGVRRYESGNLVTMRG